jgi:hypothetical protein
MEKTLTNFICMLLIVVLLIAIFFTRPSKDEQPPGLRGPVGKTTP